MRELTKIVYILLATHIFYPFLAVEKNSLKLIRISMNYHLNHQGISFEHEILYFFFVFVSMYILILFSDILKAITIIIFKCNIRYVILSLEQ